jgi:hypothetical protein
MADEDDENIDEGEISDGTMNEYYEMCAKEKKEYARICITKLKNNCVNDIFQPKDDTETKLDRLMNIPDAAVRKADKLCNQNRVGEACAQIASTIKGVVLM